MLSNVDSAIDPKTTLLAGGILSRTDVNELILKLEKQNPTIEPAKSKLLNGVWELAVSGVGSPGLLVYQVLKIIGKGGIINTEEMQVTISSVTPRVDASVVVKFGSARLTVSTTSDLEVLSGTVLKESVTEAKVDSFTVPIPSAFEPRRELVVSYLDEDLLVVRDPLGSAELLKRKSKDFAASTLVSTPSTEDDTGAPGSG